MSPVLVFWMWVLTALSGLAVLSAWLSTPTVRRARTARGHHRRLPPSLVFSHVAGAACGLLVWGTFVFWGRSVFAWTAVALIVGTAVLGLIMFARWVPTYRLTPEHGRGRRHLESSPATTGRHRRQSGRPTRRRRHRQPRADRRNLPLTLVSAHGVLAVVTLTLVLATALMLARS